MKITKVKQSALALDFTTVLKDAPFGVPVNVAGAILMRVKPVNFLLNSAVITDAINRGNVIMVNLAKGTCYAMDGTTPYKAIDSELMWSEK